MNEKLREGATSLPWHEEVGVVVAARPDALFDYLDDPARLGAHMSRRSWRTAGARMAYEYDGGQGRHVGAKIRLTGDLLGLTIAVDETVTERVPPHVKVWETNGAPRL